MEGKVAAIVPLKGSSERIPDKNIRPFGNKPLYHHLIEKLQKSELVSSILIDTDSLLIAEEAAGLFPKAEIIIRPPHLSGDPSLDKLLSYEATKTDEQNLMQVLCTYPLISLSTLEAAVRCYFSSGKPLISTQRIPGVVKKENEDDLFGNDGLDLFHFSNAFFIVNKESFFRSGNDRYSTQPEPYELNKLEGLGIEYPDDFELAEFLFLSSE